MQEVACAGAKDAGRVARRMWPGVASLYKGVVGAASGAGIYIGTYFAFYGTACNLLSTHSSMSPGGIAFVAGGIAAAGGSVVKVPLAVCIRSVQVRSCLPMIRGLLCRCLLTYLHSPFTGLCVRNSWVDNLSSNSPAGHLFIHCKLTNDQVHCSNLYGVLLLGIAQPMVIMRIRV